MSEKKDTESIRISQVLAGALAAVTAAVLGSTMGFAGTVAGAGLASVITTVGGTIYLRSIQRTRERVATVREMVVARAGASSVTLVEERTDEGAGPDAGAQGAVADLADGTGLETRTEVVAPASEGSDTQPNTGGSTRSGATPPVRRKVRWPALIGASALAFALGMLVIFGVELVRGEPLSGGDGTTLGRIVRVDDGGGREQAPPATTKPTAPETGPPTVTVTETLPPTGQDAEQPPPPEEQPGQPEPSAPETTTGGEPTGGVSVPPTGQSG